MNARTMRLIIGICLAGLALTILLPIDLLIVQKSRSEIILKFYPLLFISFFLRNRDGQTTQIRNIFFVAFALIIAVWVFSVGISSQQRSLIFVGVIIICGLLMRSVGLRISAGGYFLFLLIPPFTTVLSLLVGFDLRLIETSIAARVLQQLDVNALAQGNGIFFRGNWFVVDPVCEGLKLGVALSIFSGLVLTEKKLGKWFELIASKIWYLVVAITLWLLGNQLRIITIVLGNISPQSLWHDFTGWIIAVNCCAIPLYVYSASLFESKPVDGERLNLRIFRLEFLAAGVAASAMVIVALTFRKVNPPNTNWPEKIHTLAYNRTAEENSFEAGVYRAEEATLILKRYLSPLTSAHHPRLCWEGLGYIFSHEEQIKTTQGTIHSALMRRNSEELWIFWWYAETGSPWVMDSEILWRYRTLFRGANFKLFNLLGKDRRNLEKLAKIMSVNQY